MPNRSLLPVFALCGALAPGLSQGLTLADAVASAVRANPSVLRAGIATGLADAAVVGAGAPFDWNVSAGATRGNANTPLRSALRDQLRLGGYAVDLQASRSASLQASATRLMENGWVPTLAVQTLSSTDNLSRLQGVPLQRTTSVNLELALPLLRNNGAATADAREAARLERDASTLDLRMAVSRIALTVAQAYWDCVAREQQLAIVRASEQRAERLASDTERLIAADEQPAAERDLVQGSLAQHRVGTLSARLARDQARRALAQLLALPSPDALLDATLEQDLPPAVSMPPIPAVEVLVGRRDDLGAARARVGAGEAQANSARQTIKPQLDVAVGLSKSGLAEGGGLSVSPSAPFARTPGIYVSLNLQLPVERSAGNAELRSRLLLLDAARVTLAETERGAAVAVAQAEANLRTATLALAQSEQVAQRYRAALESERKRRQLSQSTIIDLLNVEDRYDNSQAALIGARLAWADALAQWQFETAALLEGEAPTLRIRADRLLDPTTP